MSDLMPMERDDHDEKRLREEVKVERPKYPHGLKLHLDHDTLKRLGFKKMPDVGTELPIMALAEIVSVSQDGEEKNEMVLQIKEMAVKPKKTDIQENEEKFYGD